MANPRKPAATKTDWLLLSLYSVLAILYMLFVLHQVSKGAMTI